MSAQGLQVLELPGLRARGCLSGSDGRNATIADRVIRLRAIRIIRGVDRCSKAIIAAVNFNDVGKNMGSERTEASRHPQRRSQHWKTKA